MWMSVGSFSQPINGRCAGVPSGRLGVVCCGMQERYFTQHQDMPNIPESNRKKYKTHYTSQRLNKALDRTMPKNPCKFIG